MIITVTQCNRVQHTQSPASGTERVNSTINKHVMKGVGCQAREEELDGGIERGRRGREDVQRVCSSIWKGNLQQTGEQHTTAGLLKCLDACGNHSAYMPWLAGETFTPPAAHVVAVILSPSRGCADSRGLSWSCLPRCVCVWAGSV